MFVGFNVKLSDSKFFMPNFLYYYEIGKELFRDQNMEVEEKLKGYALKDGMIDASQIEEDWFPNVEANVFISHSHMDQELAIALAGWLYKMFGIKSFIDSCVWGYADKLLKIIDRKHCVNKRKPDGSIDTYDYEKRNQSTAHVHMILNTALQKMIDKTECLFFLNTPNSLIIEDIVNGSATASPWIYSELTFSRICQKKKLSEYRPKLEHGSINEHFQLDIKYDVSLSHLENLGDGDLKKLEKYRNQDPIDALDNLYDMLEILPTGE